MKRRIVICAAVAAFFVLVEILCQIETTPKSGNNAPVVVNVIPASAVLETPSLPILSGEPNDESGEVETLTETSKDQTGSRNTKFGYLLIRGKRITVADNVDEATLMRSPGWMPDSAPPGEAGMCVILGHRNRSHLRILESVKIGDEIKFVYADRGMVTYIAKEAIIYENTADWKLPAVDGDCLVLVTCWPFRYTGHAPGKFVLVCSMKPLSDVL